MIAVAGAALFLTHLGQILKMMGLTTAIQFHGLRRRHRRSAWRLPASESPTCAMRGRGGSAVLRRAGAEAP